MTGDDDQDVSHPVETLFEISVGGQIRREADAGHIALVFALHRHHLKEVKLAHTAQAHVTTAAGKLQGQRCTPGARPDDRDGLCGGLVYQCVSAGGTSAAAAFCCCACR